MTFTDEQKAALAAPLSREHVKTRTQAGRTLSYVEGWHAIAEANRIFGFDAWSSETVEITRVAEYQRNIGQSGSQGWGVSYTAKVRVTIGGIVREGVGSGHGIDRDLGLAHESAIKEAETDARKRALMTFGNPFGLALYDKTQENVEDAPDAPARKPTGQPIGKLSERAVANVAPKVSSGKPLASDAAYIETFRMAVEKCEYESEIRTFWEQEADNMAARGIVKGTADHNRLINICATRKAALLAADGQAEMLRAG